MTIKNGVIRWNGRRERQQYQTNPLFNCPSRHQRWVPKETKKIFTYDFSHQQKSQPSSIHAQKVSEEKQVRALQKQQQCITQREFARHHQRSLIPHKLSIVVYRNPSKWPHSSSHALKALSPFPRRRWTEIHQYGVSGGSRIVKSSLAKMGAACWVAVFSIMRFDSFPPSSCSVSQHMTERMLSLNLLESRR